MRQLLVRFHLLIVLSPLVLGHIASSVRCRSILSGGHALGPVQMDLLLLLRLLEDDSIDFININFELFGTLLDLRFSLFFCIYLWFLIAFTLNLDLISLLVFAFQLLFIIFFIIKSKEVFYGLAFTDGWWQVCKAIAEKDWVAPIVQYVLSDHLLQWLLLHFFTIKFLDLHNILALDILWLVLTILELALSFLIVSDEIVDNALQLLDGPPFLRLSNLGCLITTSCKLRLIDLCYKLANESIEMLRLFSIHSPLHLSLGKLVGYMDVVPHTGQCLVNFLFTGYQLGIVLLVNFNILRLVWFVVIIRISRVVCSFFRTRLTFPFFCVFARMLVTLGFLDFLCPE